MSNKFTNGMLSNTVPQTLTENGDWAFYGTGDYLVDAMTDLPNARQSGFTYGTVRQYFNDAFNENPELTMRMLFWLRDIRGIGQGERKVFYTGMRWLSKTDHSLFVKMADLIPHYGGWMDVFNLIYPENNGSVITDEGKEYLLYMVKTQLIRDLQSLRVGESVSLLGKWMPSESNNKNSNTHARWNHLRTYLGYSPKSYRKIVSALRKEIDIVESRMSKRKWASIKYSAVPSRAMKNYTKAFNRHDGERFSEYLENVKSGNVKMNVTGLTPHNIVEKSMRGGIYHNRLEFTDEYDAHWFAFLEKVSQTKRINALPVIDTSGSMFPTEIYHALAFGIATAQTNTGDWHGLGYIFSDTATEVNLSGKSLSGIDLPSIVSSSTNIDAVMKKILDIGVSNSVPEEDMPKVILILSDMQFNGRMLRGANKSFFERMKQAYAYCGYKMPVVVFWNLSASKDKPTTAFDGDVVVMGGKSYDTLAFILSGDKALVGTPLDTALAVLTNERYDLVSEHYWMQ